MNHIWTEKDINNAIKRLQKYQNCEDWLVVKHIKSGNISAQDWEISWSSWSNSDTHLTMEKFTKPINIKSPLTGINKSRFLNRFFLLHYCSTLTL